MTSQKLERFAIDIRGKARETLAGLPPEGVRDLLAMSRWTCDSHWMMAMVMNTGWDVANRANLEAGKATGKAEMHRLMKLLGIGTPRNDEEFGLLVTLAMETFTTSDYWDYDALYAGPGKMSAIVRRCYAFTKTSSIGVENDYQCGCFGLRAGWYQAMEIDVREKLVRCLKDGDPLCEILVEASFQASD